MVSLSIEALSIIHSNFYVLLGYMGLMYLACRLSIATGVSFGKRHHEYQFKSSPLYRESPRHDCHMLHSGSGHHMDNHWVASNRANHN